MWPCQCKLCYVPRSNGILWRYHIREIWICWWLEVSSISLCYWGKSKHTLEASIVLTHKHKMSVVCNKSSHPYTPLQLLTMGYIAVLWFYTTQVRGWQNDSIRPCIHPVVLLLKYIMHIYTYIYNYVTIANHHYTRTRSVFTARDLYLLHFLWSSGKPPRA